MMIDRDAWQQNSPRTFCVLIMRFCNNQYFIINLFLMLASYMKKSQNAVKNLHIYIELNKKRTHPP